MDFIKKISVIFGSVEGKKYFLPGFAVILLLFLGIFWVFFGFGDDNLPSKIDNELAAGSSQETNFSARKTTDKNVFSPSPSALWENTTLLGAATETSASGADFEDAGLPDFAGEWMDKIAEAKESVENSAGNGFVLSQTPFPSILLPSASLLPRRLSDEEYFVKFYGVDFINNLNHLQNELIAKGLLPASKMVILRTENDLYRFLNNQVDFMEERKYISPERAKNLRNGFNVVLPELHRMERPFMEKRILGLSALKIYIAKLAASFIREAYAQAYVNDGVDCYNQIPTVNPGGFNGGSTCCNCGIVFRHGHAHYMEDCGFNGVLCDVQMGCLNEVCNGRPAIWDPMTGICGCG
jgi:hypothetical protein